MYASTSKYAPLRAESLDFNGGYSLPEAPTDAEPGSEAKLLVMAERAGARASLFHPDDRRVSPPPPPVVVRMARLRELASFVPRED